MRFFVFRAGQWVVFPTLVALVSACGLALLVGKKFPPLYAFFV